MQILAVITLMMLGEHLEKKSTFDFLSIQQFLLSICAGETSSQRRTRFED